MHVCWVVSNFYKFYLFFRRVLEIYSCRIMNKSFSNIFMRIIYFQSRRRCKLELARSSTIFSKWRIIWLRGSSVILWHFYSFSRSNTAPGSTQNPDIVDSLVLLYLEAGSWGTNMLVSLFWSSHAIQKYEVELRQTVGRPTRGLKELLRSSPTLFMGDIGEKLHIRVAYICFSHAIACI